MLSQKKDENRVSLARIQQLERELVVSRQLMEDQQRTLLNDLANARRKARERSDNERQELIEQVHDLNKELDLSKSEVVFKSCIYFFNNLEHNFLQEIIIICEFYCPGARICKHIKC